MSSNKTKIDISSWSIIKIIIILVGAYFIYVIRDVIALFFIVLILVSAFSPTINKWAKKITKTGALLALIMIFMAVVSLVLILVIPPLVEQTTQLAQNLPKYLTKISWIHDYIPQIKDALSNLSGQVGNISGVLLTFTTSIFGGMVSIIMAIVLFIYFLMDEKGLKSFLLSFVTEERRDLASEILHKVAHKTGGWFKGQLYLALIIAVLNLIALSIMGIPYAMTLAVISGIFEVIPTIGPILAGLIAALVALSISPFMALLVLIWYVIVQQLEGTLIVPKVMHKTVGLSPATIILAVLVGAKVYGLMGVVLSIPIAAVIVVIIQEWKSVKMLISSYE